MARIVICEFIDERALPPLSPCTMCCTTPNWWMTLRS